MSIGGTKQTSAKLGGNLLFVPFLCLMALVLCMYEQYEILRLGRAAPLIYHSSLRQSAHVGFLTSLTNLIYTMIGNTLTPPASR